LQQRLSAPQILGPFSSTTRSRWVERGERFVEIAAEDAEQDVIFYTVEKYPNETPVFFRRNACLTCHESLSSLGVLGMLVRSVFPAVTGAPIRQLGDFLSDHRSPSLNAGEAGM